MRTDLGPHHPWRPASHNANVTLRVNLIILATLQPQRQAGSLLASGSSICDICKDQKPKRRSDDSTDELVECLSGKGRATKAQKLLQTSHMAPSFSTPATTAHWLKIRLDFCRRRICPSHLTQRKRSSGGSGNGANADREERAHKIDKCKLPLEAVSLNYSEAGKPYFLPKSRFQTCATQDPSAQIKRNRISETNLAA